MKRETPPLHTFHSISELMRRLQLPGPHHPLATLIRYNEVDISLADAGSHYALGFYKISFKTGFTGRVKYGQGFYDFEEGGLAFLGPHQIVNAPDGGNSHEGYSFFFHPDLLRPYALGKEIARYGFFSYTVSEALFLSAGEKKIIAALFDAMEQELQHGIDPFSEDVLVSQIALLLNYSNRFYNRQFLTRKAAHHDLIDRMQAYLTHRFEAGGPAQNGLPTAQEVATHLDVSPRYLADMLKTLTGQTTQQHIHEWVIEKAKEILRTGPDGTAEIAYRLGFEHPQSFNRLFRQKTSMSPVRYRQSFGE